MSTVKVEEEKGRSEFRVTLSYLVKNKLAVFGMVILTAVATMAIFAPFLAPHDPIAMNLKARLASPSSEYPLGTDQFGRCILSRIMYGGRISLTVAILVVATSGVIGVLAGASSGFFGGKIDTLIMRLVDIVMSFPALLLAIAIMGMVGPGIINLVFAMVATYWTRWARIVRAEVLSLREREFIDAAKAFGISDTSIILRHILPNVMPSSIVVATLTMAGAVLWEASLSFVGLGVSPPAPSLGSMLSDSRQFMLIAPHMMIAPGVTITLVSLSLYLMGDGLRDALDPRLRVD